jgi:L-threonylcarbamoyladenylate synthase
VVSAADVLREGGVVLVPTDTVYGLAVDPTVPGATQRLFDLKGRRREVPIAVLVADAEQAWSVAARPVPDVACDLAARHWPGGLTIVVERDPSWPADLGDNVTTVGLRCPNSDLVRALCLEIGPLATSSANRHGLATPRSATLAADAVGGVDFVIDGGELSGKPSTVVDCTVVPPRVLREGAVRL